MPAATIHVLGIAGEESIHDMLNYRLRLNGVLKSMLRACARP